MSGESTIDQWDIPCKHVLNDTLKHVGCCTNLLTCRFFCGFFHTKER